MKRALELAHRGLRRTSPNPMVGCVIIKNGRIIGEGWHHECGHPHAEIEALTDAKAHGEDVRGATVYVTLEPCSHWGKTPPCANRLVDEGIAEAVIAMRDPNPKVDGKGIEILRSAGIKVTELAEFEAEAKFLNRGFVFVQKYARPFVTVKMAMSLDGRMCLANGSSKWLTGIEARTLAHAIRAENDAVLVGVGTVLADDPELTVRNVAGINPLRVVLDDHGRIPKNAKVFGQEHIESNGKCVVMSGENLHDTLRELAHMGVNTLMVEGGARVISSFLREGLADYVKVFLSPRILGEGRGIEINAGFGAVSDALKLSSMKSTVCGEDILLEGRLTCSPDL